MNQPRTGSAKPRLLVLASTYPRWHGDYEPGFVHELARRLTDDFDVAVLAPHAPGAATDEILDGVRVFRYRYAPGPLETLVNSGGIVTNLKRQPWKWLLVPGFALAMSWRVLRLVHRWKPDVIHAHWLLPQGLIVALLGCFNRRMPPFLVTSHGADLYALRARPLQALKRFTARRAAAITVVSAPMCEELRRLGVPAERMDVQPMGVDLREHFAPRPTVGRSRDEILFVGRLVEKKGLRHLIDALPLIRQAHPTAYLTIAGFGPEEAERRMQAQQLGLSDQVNFLGALKQSDLPALYQRAAVFVAPFAVAASGDQEGLGLVAVEAAGCGCPLVLSDLAQTRDTFAEEHVTWAKASDSESLAAACIGVLSNPNAAALWSSQAREGAVIRFDWDRRAAAYRDRLIALVGIKPGDRA